MRNSFNVEYCIWMHIAFGYGFLNTVFSNHVYYGRILDHADCLVNPNFSAVIELVFDVKSNLSLSQCSAKHFAIADGEKNVSTYLLEINVNFHVLNLLQLFYSRSCAACIAD